MRKLIAIVPLCLLVAAQGTSGRDKVVCVFGDAARPVPCVLADTARANGHQMVFTAGRQRATFSGSRNSAWWRGQLNGKPAMGYEVNRGHTVYSTLDLQNRFEWWYPGQRDGS